MRTPKGLYAYERIIYHPELLTCPHCGELLVMYNHLAWDKIVQTLAGALSVVRLSSPETQNSRLSKFNGGSRLRCFQ